MQCSGKIIDWRSKTVWLSTQVFSGAYKCFNLCYLILDRPNLSNCLNLGVHTQGERFLVLAGDCGRGTPFKQPPCWNQQKLQEPFSNLSLCSSAQENTLLVSFWRGAISRLFSTAGRNEINCLRMISKGWQNSLLLWQQTRFRKKGRACCKFGERTRVQSWVTSAGSAWI